MLPTQGHNYIGHNYMGSNCIGHNYMGHNYVLCLPMIPTLSLPTANSSDTIKSSHMCVQAHTRTHTETQKTPGSGLGTRPCTCLYATSICMSMHTSGQVYIPRKHQLKLGMAEASKACRPYLYRSILGWPRHPRPVGHIYIGQSWDGRGIQGL